MKTISTVRKNSLWSRGFWTLVLGLGCIMSACMDPADYEDPVVPDVSNGDSEASADPLITADVAATEADEGGPGQDLGDSQSQSADSGDEIVPESCACLFDLPTTTPLPQTFVWLTGDFVTPPWSMDIADGALEMEINGDTANWEVVAELSNGELINYKFLVGWADNPGPVWGNEDEDYSAEAANSSLLIVCGEAPCNVQ